MISQTQITAAIQAQILPQNLQIGQSDTAVVKNIKGDLQTIWVTRTK